MKFSEEEIRFALVNYLAKSNNGKKFVIASEMHYAYKTKRADLVYLDEFCSAFEIKSDYDNDYRLNNQINDYVKTFDYVYLVLTKNNYKNFDISSNRVGVIIFDGDKLFIKRKSKLNKKLSKIHLASSCNAKTLSNLLRNLKFHQKKYDDLVQMAVEYKKIPELRFAFHVEIANKFVNIYPEFLKNKKLSRFITID